jgi:hypothetical protein
MQNFNKIWKNFLTEGTLQPQNAPIVEKVLREITEDEMTHIVHAIDEMEPSDLAFDELFDGKKRLVLDFKTLDIQTDLGRFIHMWKEMGYEVDWKKGTLSAEQELTNTDPGAMADDILGGRPATSKRQIKMKIGKFLSKVHQLAVKYNTLHKTIIDATGSYYSGNDVEHVLGAENAKRFYNISDQYTMYTGGGRGPAYRWRKDPQKILQMAQFWQQKADWIKKNLAAAQTNEYSIILTRHPIDVFRMSDFDAIESCHSPPSRGGPSEYYKCAVAEAHGHGAVAYVVKTDDLLTATDTTTIEEAEKIINRDEEIFEDDERYMDSGSITPLSRLRLRQVRFYRKDEELGLARKYATLDDLPDDLPDEELHALVKRIKQAGEVNPYGGIQMAIPEERIYGAAIPGFRERVTKWAREHQKTQMKQAPRSPNRSMSQHGEEPWQFGTLDLRSFLKFGGSYEDTAISSLIIDLFGKEVPTVGNVIQDKATEDELDLNLVGGLIERWDTECEDIANEWNNRYRYSKVTYRVEDDGADGAYIAIDAIMNLDWDPSEWVKLPAWNDDLEWVAYELDGLGYPYFNKDGITVSKSERGTIVATLEMVTDRLPDFGGMGYAYSPDGFTEFCAAVDKVDDIESDHGTFTHILERGFKREGWMTGGGFQDWAMAVYNEETDSGDWELITREGYEMDEFEYVDASIDAQIAVSGYIEPEKYALKWDSGMGAKITVSVNNYPVAYVYKADDGGYEVTESENVDGYYDTFQQAKTAIEAAYAKRGYAYDKIEKLLESREFSILLKNLLAKPAMEKAETEMFPPEWKVELLSIDENDAMIRVRMYAEEHVPDDAIKTAREITEMWEGTEVEEKAAEALQRILRAMGGPQTEVKRIVNTWKDFLREA